VSNPSKFCHNCGSELPPGSTFCPKCGTPVFVSPPSSTTTPPPSSSGAPSPSQPPTYYDRRDYRRERRRHEKQEKYEKQEKGEKGEKGGGGIIGPIIGGGILIWLGISFYLQQIGYFTGNWWAVFIVGIGLILIVQGLLLYSRHKRPIIGPFIGGGVLVVIGLSFLYNSLGNIWPLILVVVGIAVLASAVTARRRTPNPVP